MTFNYLGEIKLVGFNFAPQGWALAAGQTLPISQNTALFSLLGTNYGGNGTSNFQLPNLQGSTIAGVAQSGDFSFVGEQQGTETATVSLQQYPTHSHPFNVNSVGGGGNPANNFLASVTAGNPPPAGTGQIYVSAAGATLQTLNAGATPALSPYTGGGQAHANMQPFLTMNYVIAMSGQFPARN